MMRGVVEYNPAARARPPRLVRESSHTPIFEEAEIVAFLDSITLESLKDIRDKAIFSVLFYSWCRVSALINLTVADYYERGGTRWLRFQEKRGKEHEVPVHSKAKDAVDLWLECSHLASKPSAPLFPSFGKNRETIESRRLGRRSVLKLVEKRARTSGILKRVCCHSFRATGVSEYMNSGGTIEIAQRIAGHISPATTRIYDRSGDRLTLEEVERVQIGKKQAIWFEPTQERQPGKKADGHHQHASRKVESPARASAHRLVWHGMFEEDLACNGASHREHCETEEKERHRFSSVRAVAVATQRTPSAISKMPIQRCDEIASPKKSHDPIATIM
jgi:site-specific recombinase XerD